MELIASSMEFSLPQNQLPEHLQNCRLKNKFTDVKIKVGDKEFPAHKVVLEGSSPMLKAWLSENWSSSSLNVYEFKEELVDPEVVEDLLTFFYTSKVLLTTENAQSICVAAHFLNIPALLSGSERFLSERVHPSNVFELFLLSDKLELESLGKSCVDCFFENYETVFKDSKLIGFTEENLLLVMRELNKHENDLKYKEILFETLISWVEHDLDERSSSFSALLNCLSVGDLSKQFISENVVTKQIISDSNSCMKLVMEALAKVSSNNLLPSKALNKLYCFGGVNEKKQYLSSVSNLNFSTGKWNNSAPMRIPIIRFAAALLGSKVYVCGGKITAEERVANFNVFDCTTNTWTILTPMPEERSSLAAVAHNQFIYVVGGADSKGTALSSAIRYSVESDGWSEIKAMQQTARSGHQLIELNDHLYAFGGKTKNVEKYDPEADTWTPVADMNFIHSEFGAASLNNKIYVLSSAGFEVYTPESNTWRPIESVLREYNGRTLSAVKGKLYALGGGQNYATRSMFEFDPTTELWRQLPDMDIPRKYHCSIFINP